MAQLDRRTVARVAYQRFGARRMARDYLRLYARSIARDLTVSSLLELTQPETTQPDAAPLAAHLHSLEAATPQHLAFADRGE